MADIFCGCRDKSEANTAEECRALQDFREKKKGDPRSSYNHPLVYPKTLEEARYYYTGAHWQNRLWEKIEDKNWYPCIDCEAVARVY